MPAENRNTPAIVAAQDARDSSRLSPSSSSSAFLTLPAIGALLRRYGPPVAGAAAVGAVAGGLWALMTPASFTAGAQLVIDPKAAQLSREEARESPGSVESAQVESQMAVMRSARIAEKVVNRLDLTKEPMFARAVRGAASPAVAVQAAGAMLGRELDVRRAGMSYVINVVFTAPEPALAAKVANAVAEVYVEDAREARAAAAGVGAEWLERRVAQLRKEMNEAALALQEFKAGRDYRIYRRQPQENASSGEARSGNTISWGARSQDNTAPHQGGAAPDGGRGGQNVRFDRNTLEELETTAQSYRKIYETALQGYAEAVQRQSNPLVETRMLSPASQPLGKSHPRTKLIILLGGLIGLLGGAGVAVTHWNLDRSLRTASAARDALHAPCLGVLPLLWRPALRRGWFAGRNWRQRLRSFLRRLTRRRHAPTITLFRTWNFIKPDPFQHAMANVVTMMATLERHQHVRAIGVTSARRGEGKSTVAGNLACLLAASGFRILLIDADFRRSVLSRAAGFRDNGSGLAHVLLGRAHVRDSLVKTPAATGVTLLPAEASAGATFDALLGSGAMAHCLEEALAGHDVVIVDLPSLDESPAALAIAPLLSGVLLTIRWGATPADAAADAVAELHGAGGRVIGSIINMAA